MVLEVRKGAQGAPQRLALLSLAAEEDEVLSDREWGEDPVPFRNVADPGPGEFVGGPSGDVLAVQENLPTRGSQEPGRCPQQRRLPSPVGPDERHDRRLRDGQVDVS